MLINLKTFSFRAKFLKKGLLLLFLSSSLLYAQSPETVLPSAAQAQWAKSEIGVIIHLDINIYAPATFDYKQKSTLPDINLFNPTRLNTDQWIRTAKAADARYALLTVKHGTGFGLWPSKVNTYNVGHTRWKNGKADILKNFISSCKKYGIKPGIYYNTNVNTYYQAGYVPFKNDSARSAYNQVVLKQLTELWTNYGKFFEIWFDGGLTANDQGGIENPVLKLIHQYQPQAVLFQGPLRTKNIVRWIGNEDGFAAYPQWSRTNATTASNGVQKIDGLNGNPGGKYWCPGESDFPIRRNSAWNGGWLWKAGEEKYLFSVNELIEKYEKSVGRNTNMLVGMVVDTAGLIPKAGSLVFDSLGKRISNIYRKPIINVRNVTQAHTDNSRDKTVSISRMVLQEDQTKGENICSYVIEYFKDNNWVKLAGGTSVGHKRIQTFPAVKTSKIRLRIVKAAGRINLDEVAFY